MGTNSYCSSELEYYYSIILCSNRVRIIVQV